MIIVKLSHLFSKIKVQKQLYIIYLMALTIPVIFIGGYMVYHARTLLMEHYEEQTYSDNLRVKSLLLDLTSNIYSRSLALANDQELTAMLSAEIPLESSASYSGFDALLSQDMSVKSVDVYTWNTNIPESTHIHPITQEVSEEPWFQKATSSIAPFWSVQTEDPQDKGAKTELSLHTRIFLPKVKSYAVLTVAVSNNHLKNRIENSSLNTVIWLNGGNICYNTGENTPLGGLVSYSPGKGDYYLGEISQEKYRAVGCIAPLLMSYTDDVFYIASLDYEAYSNIAGITGTYIAILCLVIFIASAFIYAYSSHFSRRINTLRDTMHEASLGNYNITDSFPGEDEISQVFADLNIMIQDILHKEAAAYEAQIHTQELVNQQQKMEFKMLASQINPHFLYNTLETIRMRSLKAGNREVANAVKLLGKSMRYVLENTTTGFTSLDKELDYIQTYLAIQKLRFHDRVNYELKAPPDMDLSQYQILPLLLQPIVENAILHGLEEVEEHGKIILHIRQAEHALSITVYDNGCGMTHEELRLMKENVFHHPKESAKSIGLANIYQRICLCYGTGYGMQINSKRLIGTAVTVTIPAQNTKGENIP